MGHPTPPNIPSQKENPLVLGRMSSTPNLVGMPRVNDLNPDFMSQMNSFSKNWEQVKESSERHSITGSSSRRDSYDLKDSNGKRMLSFGRSSRHSKTKGQLYESSVTVKIQYNNYLEL